jgi:hypothetical protein
MSYLRLEHAVLVFARPVTVTFSAKDRLARC